MLSVRRTIRVPSILKSSKAAAATAKALDYARRAAARDPQAEPERFDFDASLYRANEVVDALRRLFMGVCAFCETPIPAEESEVFHFRPRSGALDQHGAASEAHYAWLAYEWDNLYQACKTCNSLSGTRFPVDKARVKPGVRGLVELRKEAPQLLDPCDPEDVPLAHLVFGKDGRVAGLTERGEMMVRVFALNRETLIQSRQSVRDELEDARELIFEAFARKQPELAVPLMDDLLERTLPGWAHSAFATQWLALTARSSERRVPSEHREWYSRLLQDRLGPAAFRSAADRHAAFDRLDFEEERQGQRSVGQVGKAADLAVNAQHIDRIQIRNFRGISHLDIRFSTPEEEQAPWLMLLGENGVGKSSVLQATTLALLGEAGLKRLKIKPSDILTHGESQGWVKVTLAGRKKPIQLLFDRTPGGAGSGLRCVPLAPQVLLMAYGSTRLLDGGGKTSSADARPYARVRNLFDARVPLGNLDEYLSKRDDAAFRRIKLTLKDLLFLPKEANFVREDDEIKVNGLGKRVALRELSDGYQSTVALAIDICKVLLSFAERTGGSRDLRHAEGIVLVDEIGAHLHPVWKKQVVPSLRQAFPRVQFLMTTHDPLCLRGMRNGEIVVLKKNERKRIYMVEDLPPIEGMRVDQILASEHFGLESSRDERVDEALREYHRLLGKKRSKKQEAIFRKAKARLSAFKVLGATRRERLLYQAIDLHIAQEQDARLRQESPSKLSESMAKQMSALLKGALS